MARRDDSDDELKQRQVRITLSKDQVEQVARVVGRRDRDDQRRGSASLRKFAHGAQMRDPQLSRTLQLGLVLLAAVAVGGGEHAISDLAADLGFNPSTIHRYARTLVRVGLIEQNPASRKYRLAKR